MNVKASGNISSLTARDLIINELDNDISITRVKSSFTLNANFNNLTVDISNGTVIISRNNDIYEVSPDKTTLKLTNNTTNHIYLGILGSNIKFHIDTNNTSPTYSSVYIGTVDTSSNTTTSFDSKVVGSVPKNYTSSGLPQYPSAYEGTFHHDTDRGIPCWWDRDHWEWPNFVDDVLLSAQTVTDTTTRTSVWNPDINKNSLVKGRVYQMDLHGIFQTKNTSSQFTVDIDLAGTDVAGIQNAQSNADPGTPWTLELTFSVREDGNNGKLKANTRATFNEQPRTASHSEISVDTTTATALEVFFTWNESGTDNSVTLEQAHLKQMA